MIKTTSTKVDRDNSGLCQPFGKQDTDPDVFHSTGPAYPRQLKPSFARSSEYTESKLEVEETLRVLRD